MLVCEKIRIESKLGDDAVGWNDIVKKQRTLQDSTLGNLVAILARHAIEEHDLNYLRWLKVKRDFFYSSLFSYWLLAWRYESRPTGISLSYFALFADCFLSRFSTHSPGFFACRPFARTLQRQIRSACRKQRVGMVMRVREFYNSIGRRYLASLEAMFSCSCSIVPARVQSAPTRRYQ